MANDSARNDLANPQRDWAAEATDTVINVVDAVKSKTTDRISLLAKVLVYGILILILGVALLFWVLIALFRVLNLIPGDAWSAYLALGVVFTAGGLLSWKKRGRLVPTA